MLLADATLSILNYTRSKGFKLEQLNPFLVGA